MTMVFKLQNGEGGTTDKVLSLLNNGSTGFTADVWAPRVATPRVDRVPNPVVEIIETRVKGSNQDNLAQHVQSLHDMQRWADQYMGDRQAMDGAGVGPVWLHSKMNSETGERRALVRGIDTKYARDIDSDFYGGMVESNNLMEMALAIERGPYWERTTSSTGSQTSGIDSVGGLYDYTSASATDVPGDVPARVEKLEIWSNITDMSVIWAGFRSAARHTDPVMQPIMSLHELTLGANSTNASDPTACEASNVTVSFATSTGWADRVTATRHLYAGVEYLPNSGMALMLLRAHVSSGATGVPAVTCDVRVQRYEGDATFNAIYSEPVRVNSTVWTIYPLGYHDNGGLPSISVQARRLSTAGSLYLDRMVMLPVDEYFLYAEGTNCIGSSIAAEELYFKVRADDGLIAYSGHLGMYVRNAAQSGAGVPQGDGRMVVVAARKDRQSNSSDTLTMKLSHFPRYVSLRGAD